MRRSKIIGDVFLNIIASCVPLLLFQLAILPLLAAQMTEQEYGLVVTLVALLNLVPMTVGNALCNVRLLHGSERDPYRESASFSLDVLQFALAGTLVTFLVACWYAGGVNVVSIGIAVASLLSVYREYWIVSYRLALNYRHILLNNLCMAVGYIAGYGLFVFTGFWEFVYLAGLMLSLIYLVCTTELWREPLRLDCFFPALARESGILLGSSLLGKSTAYADRMVLFPLLGGAEVSIYYVSTLFGKVLSMGISPISSVMLSYLAKLDARPKRAFWYSLGFGAVLAILAYCLTLFLAQPLLELLYPQFVDEAMPYVWVVTVTAYLGVLVSIADPFVLRFFSLEWQIAKNGLFSILYFVLALLLLHWFGLMGFCLGCMLATGAKLLFLVVVYSFGREKP